jgi:hypothetical protein
MNWGFKSGASPIQIGAEYDKGWLVIQFRPGKAVSARNIAKFGRLIPLRG